MFKKKLATLLIAATVAITPFALTGCGSSGESGEGTKQEEKKTEDLTLVGEIEESVEYESPTFRGEIKNNTDRKFSYVEINIILYDKDNAQVGTAWTNTSSLKAGGTWKFEAASFDANAADYDHYEYEIMGD